MICFRSDSGSGSGSDFKEVSAQIPDPATLVSALRKLRGNFLGKFLLEKRFLFILIVHLVKKLWFLSEKFCFKFIPSKSCPDPAKSFGSHRIRIRLRIRIHNTVFFPLRACFFDLRLWLKKGGSISFLKIFYILKFASFDDPNISGILIAGAQLRVPRAEGSRKLVT